MVFLRQSLFFQIGQIATDGIRRNLQLFCQLSDAGLALFSNNFKYIFLSGGFMHGCSILQNVAILCSLQHFTGKGIVTGGGCCPKTV
ncbi:Uncharacterised protein [Enterobacter cloacae]|nr:Uncharacterised protein [Enterobacter cloacae]